MNGAEWIARCLAHEGVTVAFGVPGETAAELVAALSRTGIRPIATHSAAAAAWMAAAHCAFSRRPGVVFAGAEAGAAELAPALGACTHDGFPLVAVLGGAALHGHHTVEPQELDLSWALRPFCKQTVSLAAPAHIAPAVRAGFRLAFAEKPGAVALALPADVAAAPVPDGLALLPRHQPAAAHPAPPAVEEAARRLQAGATPLILVGHGTVRTGAHQELQVLAERTGLPVITTYMAKSAFPADHPLYTCSAGPGAPDNVYDLVRQADTVLCVGFDPAEWPPEGWLQPGQSTLIELGQVRGPVTAHYNPATVVAADLKASLSALAAVLTAVHRPGWTGPGGAAGLVRAELVAEYDRGAADARFPLHPTRLLAELRRHLRRQDVLTVDVGAHHTWAGRLYPVVQAGTYYTSGVFQAMGFALPSAAGLALGIGYAPDHRVAALTGDGGFLARCAEVETAARLQLPLVTVVAVDGRYAGNAVVTALTTGEVAGADMRGSPAPAAAPPPDRAKDPAAGDAAAPASDSATRFSAVDVARLAEAMGAIGLHVREPGALPEALTAAFQSGRTAVVAVPVDPAAYLPGAAPPRAFATR